MNRRVALLFMMFYYVATFGTALASSKVKIIESFHVRSDIRYRFATTQIESVVRNAADSAQEISFDVTLPKEAFIVSFSMEIDGKIYDGEVKEKAEAKQVYQAAVDRGQSAGHIKQVPRHSNAFQVSVNVANGSAVNFTLTYQEILCRKFGVYEHEVHVDPGQQVEDFRIEVFIQEIKPLKFVRTPALRTGSLLTNRVEAENRLTIIDRPTPETAYIEYKPTRDEQGGSGISARFVVEYDVEHSTTGDVVVVDGYFIHFFAPDLPSMPKDIVFVLDKSGSMHGQSIQQLKTAMEEILDDLQPEDRFNIITFSDEILKWRKGLSSATVDVVNEAKKFVLSISADGLTDIDNALREGIIELRANEEKQRIGMIFFLTDGQPTSGVTNSNKIAANVLEFNGKKSAIFGLAFGAGADYELLKTICSQNSGFAKKIYEDSDASLQVASLYKEISAVSATNISIEYMPGSVDKPTVTDNKFPFIFKDSEVIVCGRMADDVNVFEMKIIGTQKSGSLDLVSTFRDVNNLVIDSDSNLNKFFTMPRDLSGIVEKMWAFMTIKQLLKEQEKFASDENKLKELKDMIIQRSLKYKFVTPHTSMVVTKPESLDKYSVSELEDADKLSGNQHGPLHQFSYYSSAAKNSGGYHSSQRQHYGGFPPLGGGGAARYSGGYHSFHRQHYGGFPPLGGGSGMHGSFGLTSGLSNLPDELLMSGHDKNLHQVPLLSESDPPKDISKKMKVHRPLIPDTKTFPLSAIIVSTHSISVCVAPKKFDQGSYELLKSANGTRLYIKVICTKRKCKDFLIEKLRLESNGQSAEIFVDEKKTLKHQTTSFFSVTQVTPDGFEISGGGLQVKIESTFETGSVTYFMEIRVNSGNGYSGLLGNILNMPTKKLHKWRKAKVPPTCRNKGTGISRSLTNKMATPYKVQ